MKIVVILVLLVGMTSQSSGTYCICKDGIGDSAMQKTIDYACGAGADCSGILAKGACYNPNTLKDHCNYAVNSYFQRKGQATGTCDFAGSASPSTSIPSQSSGCVYQSSPSSSTTPPSSNSSTFLTPPGIYTGLGPSNYNGDSSSANLLTTHLVGNLLFVPLALATTSTVCCFSGLLLPSYHWS